jgi:hypothetical protein
MALAPGPDSRHKLNFKCVAATRHCHISCTAEEFFHLNDRICSICYLERAVGSSDRTLFGPCLSLENISDDVYETATDGLFVEELDVRAPDIAGLVAAFRNILADAAMSGDFTKVLSTERSFYL